MREGAARPVPVGAGLGLHPDFIRVARTVVKIVRMDRRDASGVHRVLLWGGTSFNFGRKLDRLDAYIDSVDRTAALVEREKIDVLISNHSGYDGAIEKLERRRVAPPGAPNPFVMGTPAVLRALRVMGECAKAQRDRYLSAPG